MSHPFYAYLSRMRYINRWGLMRNTIQENIQEHSHMVSVFAHALALIRNELFGGTVDAGKVAVAALYHDAAEIFTGDLPTPVKYQTPEIRAAYQKIEEGAAEKLLSMLPDSLQGAYRPVLSEEEAEVTLLVKAADKLSAYVKCVEELKGGNLEFRSAAMQTKQALDTMELPELNYFMEQFLPAFSLTLDELQSEKEGI